MQKTVFKTQKMDKTFQILYFGLMIFLLGIAIFTSIVEKDTMAFYVMGGLVLFLGLVISSSFFNMKIVFENGELKKVKLSKSARAIRVQLPIELEQQYSEQIKALN